MTDLDAMETAAAAGPASFPAPVTVNPDPRQYKKRARATFSSEAREALGLIESGWEPLDDGKDGHGETASPGQPLFLPQDLRGYQPLRLCFVLRHPDREMNDDWFEVLLSTLRDRAADFARTCFGMQGDSAGGSPAAAPDDAALAHSPWGDPALTPPLLYYASEVARRDVHAGGWDALLTDRRQRAYLVQGVLARVLDDHVFSALLFGGTAGQQEALEHWDRVMLEEEGYVRKFRRCEEVQHILDEDTVTAHFWAEVDRVTAQTAALLLPLLNIQRRMAAAAAATAAAAGPEGSKGKPRRAPGLRVVYQRLHDIVALAGYASLCMARSTSIFQVEFPEPGQMWEADQERVDDQHVYAVSRARARQADAAAAAAAGHTQASAPEVTQEEEEFLHLFGGGGAGAGAKPLPLRTAKVKIVLWPRITRYKPQWDMGGGGSGGGGRHHRRSSTGVRRQAPQLRSATRTVVTKSYSAYYSGRLRDDDDEIEAGRPSLPAHVAAARRARRRTAAAARVRRLAAVLLLLSLLAALGAGLLLLVLAELPQGSGGQAGAGRLFSWLLPSLDQHRLALARIGSLSLK